jgi:hypothetical protein
VSVDRREATLEGWGGMAESTIGKQVSGVCVKQSASSMISMGAAESRGESPGMSGAKRSWGEDGDGGGLPVATSGMGDGAPAP